MGRLRRNNLHVLLADGRTDKERIDTANGIIKLAPQSAVYAQHPEVHAAVDALTPIVADLKSQGDLALGLQLQLDAVKGGIDATRTKYGHALGVLRTTLEGAATTIEEVTSLGLTGRIGGATPAPLVPPTGVRIALGKKHGQFRASAESTFKGKFGAEVSSDPIGPATWVDVTGTGKRRLITGHASGTLVWVRFRIVAGQRASDWCTPVPVTVP